MGVTNTTFNLDVIDQVEKIARMRFLSTHQRVPQEQRERLVAKIASAQAGLMQAMRPYARNFALGTAAAAPAVMGGGLLINKAKRDVEDVRDKTLLGALGVGAATAGLHAASRRVPPTGTKQSADRNVNDLCNKIASAVYLDTVLERYGEDRELEGVKIADVMKINYSTLADALIELLMD